MKHKDLTQHQKELIKEVAEKLSLIMYKKRLESLNKIEQQAVYMVSFQKFLNEAQE